MYPMMDLHLDGLRVRTLTLGDADLLVEATREESARALWDAFPAGPYTLADARGALLAWDHRSAGQVSYGVLDGSRLVAAVGLPAETCGATVSFGRTSLKHTTRPSEPIDAAV